MIGLRPSPLSLSLDAGRGLEPVMSVVPQPWPQPAPQLAEALAAMYRGKRERPLPVLVRDKLGEWLPDEQFAGAYGVRGKPGWPPSRLALVTIFQRRRTLPTVRPPSASALASTGNTRSVSIWSTPASTTRS
jgi:hypothetical protein